MRRFRAGRSNLAGARVLGSQKLLGAAPMFFFFSNRMGCAGSLLLTLAGTLILLWLMGWLTM